MSKIIVYSTRITERLKYAVEVSFAALNINDYLITDNKEDYLNSTEISLNYSSERIKDHELFIENTPLLFEQNIVEQKLNLFQWRNLPAFFATNDDVGFDFFAAGFYLISRYEEYLPHKKDSYGRFAHESSIAFREQFLHLPLINLWMQEIGRLLQSKFPSVVIPPRDFKFLPTYDVDIAFSYKGKGVGRNAVAAVTSLLRGDVKVVVQQIKCMLNIADDPGEEVFSWLNKLHRRYALKPYWFFLAAKKRKGYDRNTSVNHWLFKKIVRRLSEKDHIGVHPSVMSTKHNDVLCKEKNVLEQTVGKQLGAARQHYILFNLPETFERFLDAGFDNDYSMGYGSINGFRASYCLPFRWFNLSNNKITNLMMHPFCFMDANAHFEQKYSAAEAYEELTAYAAITRQVQGKLITIFHNHFLVNNAKWLPWRELYSRFLAEMNHEKN